MLSVLEILMFALKISDTTRTGELLSTVTEREVGMPWRSTRGAEIR